MLDFFLLTTYSGPKLVSDWPSTLPLRIDQIAEQNASKIALKDGFGNILTYSDLVNRIQAISEELQKAKVVPGSRVPVFQKAASDWVCSMLAIMRLGAVYVPLNLREPLPRLASVAVDCEPTAVLVDESTVGDAAQLNVRRVLREFQASDNMLTWRHSRCRTRSLSMFLK